MRPEQSKGIILTHQVATFKVEVERVEHSIGIYY